MRRLGWGCLALLLAAAGPASARPGLPQSEQILDYHSEIDVLDDGTMIVGETIRVVCYGYSIRHGIYRDFPTHYKDRYGNNYDVGFEMLGATRDGEPEEFRVTNYANGKRIYLGRNDYLIPHGEHVYTITYTTNRQLGFFKDHDELFWNVTGNGWIFPIADASATVRLPFHAGAGRVQMGGYTGPQNSLAHNLRYDRQGDGSFEFRTTGRLEMYQGLTVLLMWPKGLIHEPTTAEKLNYVMQDNRDLLAGAAGLCVVLIYYLGVWFAVGRDPKPGTIVALYEPPSGFSPAAIRYLQRMGFDNKAFAAAVVDMAVKGYLRIEENGGTYTLYRAKGDAIALTPDEKVIAALFFGEGRTELWLHNENHTLIHAAIAALRGWLKTAEQKIFFVTNARYIVPGVIFSALALGGGVILNSGESGKLPIAGFVCFWLTIWTSAVAGMIVATGQAWSIAFHPGAHRAGLVGKAFMSSVMILPFLGGEAMGIGFLVSVTSVSIAVLLVATVFVHLLFHFLLKRPTSAGRAVLDKIEGFKMFLGAVEGDRINRMTLSQQAPETFEKCLPYAMALDVEQAWADKFAGVLGAAGQAPQSTSSSSGYSPGWYSGSGWNNFGGPSFASSFSSSFSSAISSSSAAPGSSGGGGSGGGGGGGGGGGW